MTCGVALDAAWADPRRGHPVAGFGALAAAVERTMYRDTRPAGLLYAAGLTGAVGAASVSVVRAARSDWSAVAVVALASWVVLGGTTLRREAAAMDHLLAEGDLTGARGRLSHLCGRDPAGLDEAGLVRATVESVAENTSDAVVAPLLWGAVAGVPGLLVYRAVNTLDAMVGHRSARYRRFGWAAARLDDVANVLPARLAAALTVLVAPSAGGRPGAAFRVWRRDGRAHPSPNAGQVEAAFAGALGRTLGGPLAYAGRVEQRPQLGDGPAPDRRDIGRAARLSGAVQVAALAVCLAIIGVRP